MAHVEEPYTESQLERKDHNKPYTYIVGLNCWIATDVKHRFCYQEVFEEQKGRVDSFNNFVHELWFVTFNVE
jgi:hypothetical protein